MKESNRTPSPFAFGEAIRAPHMPVLDGFRAIAAASVVLAHGYRVEVFDGVTAFFVLSGFLITTLLLRERAATGSVSLRAFYARRTLRIFPAYYACVVASFAIDRVAGHPWSAGLTQSAATYTVNYYNAFNGHPSTSIAHLWSLGVEEQFYLLWPTVFVVLAGFGLTTVRRALAVTLLGSIAWRCGLHFTGSVGQAYLYNAFDARLDNLAIGCLLALIAPTVNAQRFASSVSRYAWAPLVTLSVMTIVQYSFTSLAHHLVGFTLYSVLIAVLIMQLLQLSASPLWGWLDWRPIRFLGTISYPIYLYHGWGLGLGHWLTMLSPGGQFIAGVIFTLIGAVASHYIVERPFLNLKRRFAPGRSNAAHEASPVSRSLSEMRA